MHFTALAALLLPILASALVIPHPTTGHDNANGGALKIRETSVGYAVDCSPGGAGNDWAGLCERGENFGDDQETQAEDSGETGSKERSLEVRDKVEAETENDNTTPCGRGITVTECYFEGGYAPPPPPDTPAPY